MKHLRKYNESFNIDQIDWTKPYEEIWPEVSKEIIRIRKKIGDVNVILGRVGGNQELEWYKPEGGGRAYLVLRTDVFKVKLENLKKTEEIWDDLVPISQDIADNCRGDFKFQCIKECGRDNLQWGEFEDKEKDAAIFAFSWKIHQRIEVVKANQYAREMNKVVYQDIPDTLDILNSIKDNLKRFGLDYKKDLKYNLSSHGSGNGYGEFYMNVLFQIK